MIRGKSYYFFKLERHENDTYPEYHIAQSVEDLYLRFGDIYMRKYCDVTQLNEVTLEHIRAIEEFLFQQIS